MSVREYFKASSKRIHSSGSSETETPRKRQSKTSTMEEEMNVMAGIQESLKTLDQRMDSMAEYIKSLATKEDVSNIKKEFEALTQSFTEKMQKMEGRLFDAEAKVESLTREVRTLSKQKDTLKDTVSSQGRQLQMLEKEHNSLEQYSRRWNLRVFRVPEKEGETGAECQKKCCDVFSQQVKVQTKAQDIEIAHRTGRPGGSTPRPIIVRFFDRKKRDEVLANRRNLKGKGIVVGEDLTPATYRVFSEARQHSAILSVWTSSGNVIAKLKNGKTVRLDIHSNVNQLFGRVMAGQEVI